MSYIKRKAPEYKKNSIENLIRVNNLNEDIKDETIKDLFNKFGEIIKYTRPKYQGGKKQSRHAFIQYNNPDSCNNALSKLNGMIIENTDISVDIVKDEESVFSEDTGYITGINLDKYRHVEEFDSTMPSTHRLVKQLEVLKNVDVTYTIKVSNLNETVTEKDLDSIFKSFGQISRIEYPINLKTRKHKDYAYIRYTHSKSALNAIEKLNNKHLIQNDTNSPTVVVENTYTSRHFSQDEHQAFR